MRYLKKHQLIQEQLARMIFFCIERFKKDGHEFVDEALIKASGAVVSKNEGMDFKNKTVVIVDDTLKSLQNLAGYLRKNLRERLSQL